MKVDEMIMVRDISLTSTCEHHFVTHRRLCPRSLHSRGKVIGLSKSTASLRFFARRPQVQERLTQQILLALQTLLGTRDVAISIKATRFCVKARGVMDSTSLHRPSYLPGRGVQDQPDDTGPNFWAACADKMAVVL